MRKLFPGALLLSAACMTSESPAPPPPSPDLARIEEPFVPRARAPEPMLSARTVPNVHTPPPTEIVKGADPAGPAAPPPAPVVAAPPRPGSFVEAVELLREVAAKNPASRTDQVGLAAALAVTDRYPEALKLLGPEPIGAASYTGTDLFVRLVGIYLHEQLGEHGTARNGLLDVADELERREGIKIDKAVLVSKVNGYEDYVPAPSNTVEPGKAFIVYLQPRNFGLKPEGNEFIMHLRYTWELFDEDNKSRYVKAWADAPAEQREDRIIKRGKVRDFFQFFQLPMPWFPSGRYTVRITVDDLQSSQKRAVAEVPIQIAEYFPPHK